MDTGFADYLRGGQHYTGQTPARVFAAHDWEPVRGIGPWRTLAPDEHAAFHIRTHHVDDADELHNRAAAAWKITTGPDPTSRPAWTASLTGHTPEPLLTAVASAVTDPEPVARPAHRIPQRHRALVSPQPAAHLARTAAAQARSPSPSAPPTAEPRPQPAATPAAPPRPTRKR